MLLNIAEEHKLELDGMVIYTQTVVIEELRQLLDRKCYTYTETEVVIAAIAVMNRD